MDRRIDRNIIDCHEDVTEIQFYECARQFITQNLTTWTSPRHIKKYADKPGSPKHGVTCTVPMFASVLPARYIFKTCIKMEFICNSRYDISVVLDLKSVLFKNILDKIN